jgi:hypothetical protein
MRIPPFVTILAAKNENAASPRLVTVSRQRNFREIDVIDENGAGQTG